MLRVIEFLRDVKRACWWGRALLKNALIPHRNLLRKLIREAFNGEGKEGRGKKREKKQEFSAASASAFARPLQREMTTARLSTRRELFISLWRVIYYRQSNGFCATRISAAAGDDRNHLFQCQAIHTSHNAFHEMARQNGVCYPSVTNGQ